MRKRIPAIKARQNLGELLEEVCDNPQREGDGGSHPG